MPTIDYLPVAAAGGANVDPQGAFAGSGYQVDGFTTGIARSAGMNKVWRQSSMIAAAVATFISNELGISVPDDGNLAALVTNLTNAIAHLASVGGAPSVVTVPFSATPAFHCAAANPLHPVFEILLTGNVTSSTIDGLVAGQIVTFHVVQNGAGGHTFVPPGSVPMPAVDGTANQVNSMSFLVLADGATLVPAGPMTLTI